MSRAPWLLSLVFVAACSGKPAPVPEPPALTPCGDPRPQVCTLQYEPVCGELAGGERNDYSSPCNACAHDEVTGWEAGVCDAAQ